MVPRLGGFCREHLAKLKHLRPRIPAEDYKTFVQAFEHAWRRFPLQPIRDYWVSYIADNRDCLWESFEGSKAIWEVLDNNADLLRAVAVALVNK